MNRRLFLQLPIVAPALAFALPPLTERRAPDQKLPKKGILVWSGPDRSGQPVKHLDATFTVKVSGKTPMIAASFLIRFGTKRSVHFCTRTSTAMSSFLSWTANSYSR